MRKLFFLTAALIVYGSLFPWEFDFSRPVLLHSIPPLDRFFFRDIVLNILLYVPLGLTAFLAMPRRFPRAVAATLATLAGLALSASMEILQSFIPGRNPSQVDIVTNFLGAAAGAFGALIFYPTLERRLASRRRAVDGPSAFLLTAWATTQLYPFFPALSQHKLRAALSTLVHNAAVSPAEVFAIAAEWFAAALLLRALLGRLRGWWLAAAMSVLGIRIFVATRIVTINEIAGAALALLLWTAIPETRRLTAGCWLMAAALLLRELAPFRFSSQIIPFTWTPFVPTLSAEFTSAVVILARKTFDYGAIVWLLRQQGVRYVRAAIALAAALFVLELLQQHLPGRTPEITDSVVALLVAAILKFCSSEKIRPDVVV